VLTQLKRKVGYNNSDAIQLATTLELQVRINTGKVTFLSADVRLLGAAQVEGLENDNPNLHK
jgi:hypothetical protein